MVDLVEVVLLVVVVNTVVAAPVVEVVHTVAQTVVELTHTVVVVDNLALKLEIQSLLEHTFLVSLHQAVTYLQKETLRKPALPEVLIHEWQEP